MKLVLLSVLMLTAAVRAAPKHARLSPASIAARRQATEKYPTGLHAGDPFPVHVRARKVYSDRRMRYPHGTPRNQVMRYRKPFRRPLREPVLNFRSPEQLQAYLFSEAGNARHILRSGASFYTPNDRLEYFHRNSRMSETNPYSQLLPNERRLIANRTRLGRHPWQQHRLMERRHLNRNGGNFRRRRPSFLPYEVPYLYPPPWYDPEMAFYLPRLFPAREKAEDFLSTPKPKLAEALGSDIIKLKHMVNELDTLNEEGGGTSAEKADGDKHEKDRNETVADVKDKIDKVIIPMLSKISKDLNGSAGNAIAANPPSSGSTPSPPPLPVSSPPNKGESSEAEVKKGKTDGRIREKEKEKDAETKQEPHLKHNFPCRIDGVWVCTMDALHLNISTMPNMTLKVTVLSENPKKSNYITKDWAINGITLASTGGPFLLAAICPEKKRVANFIGQCRSCREEDIISGLWTFSTAARDCAEVLTSFETKIDVFRRDKSQPRKLNKSQKSLVER